MAPNGLTRNNSEEFVVMDYTRIIPILTKAVQEQQVVISDQQSEIDAMKSELKELRELILENN